MSCLSREYDRLPLWSIVFLILGILLGVKYPLESFAHVIHSVIYGCIVSVLCLFLHRYISLYALSFTLGFVTVQTNGCTNELCIHKQFITSKIDHVSIYGKVKSIEDTNRKNMKKVTITDASIKGYPYIHTIRLMAYATKLNNIDINDEVLVSGQLLPCNTSIIPGAFNEKQYNCLTGVDAKCICYRIKPTKKNECNNFDKTRHNINCSIDKKLQPEVSCITKALLTGDKTSVPYNIKQVFTNTGIAHLLAISGLHMSIVVTLVFLIIHKLFLYLSNALPRINPLRYTILITIGISYLYLRLTNMSPSATRAFIMTTVCLLAKLSGRTAISLRNVVFSAYITLIAHPASLFLTSFQLSYISVITIVNLYEKTRHRFANINKALSCIIGSFITSISTSLATFPIIVSVFNQQSIISCITNIIMIPMMSIIIMPLGVIALCTSWFSDLFIKLYSYAVEIMLSMAKMLNAIPYGHVSLKAMHTTSFTMSIAGFFIITFCASRIRWIGIAVWCSAIIVYMCERNPNIILYGDSYNVAFINKKHMYVKSGRLNRLQTDNIRRLTNTELSKHRLNIATQYNFIPLYIYLDDNYELKKVYTSSTSKHPFCWSSFAAYDINADKDVCEYIHQIIQHYKNNQTPHY